MGLLDGKRVVITGAGRGLGRAHALFMAKEGASLVVNDIDLAEAEGVAAEIAAAGETAAPNGDDVAQWDGARRIVEQCVEAYGEVDVVVSNAAIYRVTPIWEITEREVDQIVGANLKGTVNLTRHALERMAPRRSGCIVNVSSGTQAGNGDAAVYSATKGGVASFTYSCAIALAPLGIRVNAVSPFAETRMWREGRGAAPTPASGPGPEKVSPLVAFLASDEAWYVTGQVIRMMGDVISLYSHPTPMYLSERPGGWTVEALRAEFKRTIGDKLEPVGSGVTDYAYYDGVGRAT